MTNWDGHRAFLLGCNSEGLQHCECDAQRMRDTLGRLGWDTSHFHTTSSLVAHCNEPSRDPYSPATPSDVVSNVFTTFLRAGRKGDTLLFYFSGHSRFRKGVFDLVVGEDVNALGDRLNVATLIARLAQQDPKQKPTECLLIFDCCEAAESVSDAFWNQQAEGWGRIWVATRRNEHAQELDEDTRGGLFTAQILRVLHGGAPSALDDDDGCLRLNQADKVVRDKAKSAAFPSGKPAPMPGAFGNTAHNILLARAGDVRPLTGFAPAMLEQLKQGLEQTTPHCDLATIFDHVSRVSGLVADAGYRGPTDRFDDIGLHQALRNLEAAWYRPANAVKLPLAEFAWRVALQAPNGATIQDWVRDAVEQLRVAVAGDRTADAFFASLDLGSTARQALPEVKSHVSILLIPRDDNGATQYGVEARLVDRTGVGDSVDAPVELVPVSELPAILARCLNRPEVLGVLRDLGKPLTIEFFLPKRLLGRDLDKWSPATAGEHGARHAPFTTRHIVAVRSNARLVDKKNIKVPGVGDPEAYLAGWRGHWDDCQPCRDTERDAADAFACLAPVSRPDENFQRLARRGACVFVLEFAPDATGDQLDQLLRTGAGAVLWCSAQETTGLRQRVIEEMTAWHSDGAANAGRRPRIADLPEALLYLRQDAWNDSDRQHSGQLHLLWDDPSRIPRFNGLTGTPRLRLQSPF